MTSLDYESLNQTAVDIRNYVSEFRSGKIQRADLDSLVNANGKIIRAELTKLGGLIYELDLEKLTNPKPLLDITPRKRLPKPKK